MASCLTLNPTVQRDFRWLFLSLTSQKPSLEQTFPRTSSCLSTSTTDIPLAISHAYHSVASTFLCPISRIILYCAECLHLLHLERLPGTNSMSRLDQAGTKRRPPRLHPWPVRSFLLLCLAVKKLRLAKAEFDCTFELGIITPPYST